MLNFASASIIEGEWIKNTKANSLHVLKKKKRKKKEAYVLKYGEANQMFGGVFLHT